MKTKFFLILIFSFFTVFCFSSNRIKNSNQIEVLNPDTVYENTGDIFLKNAITVKSPSGQGAHDSQILSIYYKLNQYTLILYCAFPPNKYKLNIFNSKTNEQLFEADIFDNSVLGKAGWAPRFFSINDSTIRILFTVDMERVFYRDFSLNTFKFGSINSLKVRYELSSGKLSDFVDFTLPIFIQHIKNSISIDLNSSAFNSFAGRSLLIEGTDQIQIANSKYYLTAEVLSDGFKYGDCGGIACLMESEDLTYWILKKPVYAGLNAASYRNHEMSMTYLNDKWNGLSRYNTDSINGYLSWTSIDGDIWTNNGLAPIPSATKGYRNSVFVFENKHLFSGKKIAAIAYQKYDQLDKVPFTEHTSQRKSIGICLTTDFVTFSEILVFNDKSFNTYPSICINGDNLYMSWSNGIYGFTEKIKFSSINLFSLFDPIFLNLEGYKAGNIQWQFSVDKQNWTDIKGANTAKYNYKPTVFGYIRAKVENCNSIYFSDTTEIRYF